MASLKLEHIYKVYPNGTKAVNDFTMDIEDKEFIVFVGPSGCGKSTTLRMIAGLEEISSGELYIDDQIVNDMEPKDRDIAMVFQNYALYPHMTVYENMAFGLQLRHMPRNEIHERVMWAANVLGLTEYLDRKPKAMSGGQRQRVALGRAILRNPKVMLLDEPLSNLDAKLRSQMRSEISKLHQNLKTTFIYVTHDQVEAMTLGTRVVVMKLGRIQQIDAPKNLYDYPINKFVAGFIGTPQMNFFDVTLKRNDDIIDINFSLVKDAKLEINIANMLKVQKQYFDGEHKVTLGIRCENLSISDEKDDSNVVPMRINHFEELGNETLVYGDLDLSDSLVIDSPTKIIVKTIARNKLKVGEVVNVKFDIEKAHFFDGETEMSISPRLPTVNVFSCEVKNDKLHVLANNFDYSYGLENGYVGEMIVPISAIRLDRKKGLKATIEKIETIDSKNLAYLRIKQHLFFALVSNKAKEGDSVTVSIDFDKVSFYKGKELIKAPIKETDSFASYFTNYETVKHNGEDKPEYADEITNRLISAKEPIEKEIEANNNAYQSTCEDLSKVDYPALHAQAKVMLKEKHASIKNAFKELMARYTNEFKTAEDKDEVAARQKAELEAIFNDYKYDYNDEVVKGLEVLFKKDEDTQRAIYEYKVSKPIYKVKKATLKAKYKADLKQATKEVNEEFARRKKEENEDYQLSKKLNKDKTTRAARKADHDIFKETLPAEKLGEITSKRQTIQQDFDMNMSSLTSENSRIRFNVKSTIKEFIALNRYYKDPLAKETKDFNKKNSVLQAKLNYEERHSSLLFFMTVNEVPYMLPNNISNKIIQGLGSRVFTKKYRLEVPHDAYIISDNGQLSGTVVGLEDYVDSKYYKVHFVDSEGVERYLYLLSDKPLKEGSTINFDIDFNKVEIYENSLNIRLV